MKGNDDDDGEEDRRAVRVQAQTRTTHWTFLLLSPYSHARRVPVNAHEAYTHWALRSQSYWLISNWSQSRFGGMTIGHRNEYKSNNYSNKSANKSEAISSRVSALCSIVLYAFLIYAATLIPRRVHIETELNSMCWLIVVRHWSIMRFTTFAALNVRVLALLLSFFFFNIFNLAFVESSNGLGSVESIKYEICSLEGKWLMTIIRIITRSA